MRLTGRMSVPMGRLRKDALWKFGKYPHHGAGLPRPSSDTLIPDVRVAKVKEVDMAGEDRYEVTAFLLNNAKVTFGATSDRNAKEVATRIITEGLWIDNGDRIQEFYPVHQIYKVKIIEKQP